MMHTRAWMHAFMQMYIHGPLYVCLWYLSLFFGLCIFVYFCSLSSPACVYGFSCGCISRGVLLSVYLTACLRVSLCLLINLHLWSAVPGVSFAVWVLCVRVHVTWILSLFVSPLFVCGWMQTGHFQAWGKWWAWTFMVPGSYPYDVSEAWPAGSLGTAPTLCSVQPCAENTLMGQNDLCWNQCLLSFCC